jgi:hypothetical protein
LVVPDYSSGAADSDVQGLYSENVSPLRIFEPTQPDLFETAYEVRAEIDYYDIFDELGESLGQVEVQRLYYPREKSRQPYQAIIQVFPHTNGLEPGRKNYVGHFFIDRARRVAGLLSAKGIQVFARVDALRPQEDPEFANEILYNANFEPIRYDDFPKKENVKKDSFTLAGNTYYFFNNEYFQFKTGVKRGPEIHPTNNHNLKVELHVGKNPIIKGLPKGYGYYNLIIKQEINGKVLTDILVVGIEFSTREDRKRKVAVNFFMDSNWEEEDMLCIYGVNPNDLLDKLKQALSHSGLPLAQSIQNNYVARLENSANYRWQKLVQTLNFHPDIPPSDALFGVTFLAALKKYKKSKFSHIRQLITERTDKSHRIKYYEKSVSSENPRLRTWQEKRVNFIKRLIRDYA